MSLVTLQKVEKLQRALHAKAKESPEFRFYSLYDKLYRIDVLTVAYERCKANGGAAGVDGETFEDIERYGEAKWLGELTEELRNTVTGRGQGRADQPETRDTGHTFAGPPGLL